MRQGVYGNSVPSAQFGYEPKTTLKKSSLLKKSIRRRVARISGKAPSEGMSGTKGRNEGAR